MKIPEKSELPIVAPLQTLELSAESIAAFHRAFQSSSKSIPWTYGAKALQGVFHIVNELQVDWRHLLHATQSFQVHSTLKLNQKLISEARLLDCRVRAGMAWLQFEILLKESQSSEILMTAKSLIMVKLETAGSSSGTSKSAVLADQVEVIKTFTFEPITKQQILDYAEASGDFNQIHLDDEFARAAGLPGVIAHGMLSMGLMARAFEEWGFSFQPASRFEAKFKDMVLPGDHLTAQLVSQSEKELRCRLLNQAGVEVISGNICPNVTPFSG